MQGDAIHTQTTQHQEPGHHHRTEQLADMVGAMFLDQEQRDQNHQSDRLPIFQAVEGQLQALNSGQDGNRRVIMLSP